MGVWIGTLSARPELAPLVAAWRIGAFGHSGGWSVSELAALILAPPVGPAESFVLFEDGQPVGTASLAQQDLDSRPDLYPWLAGVFVLPEFRGRGHASALVRTVEGYAMGRGANFMWLYTSRAEGLYLRLGWQSVGWEQDQGRPVVLMRRDF